MRRDRKGLRGMLRHKKLIIVFCVTLALLGAGAGFLSAKYAVPILMYHSVIPDPEPDNMLAVSVKSFERQMRFLKKHRYNVVSVEEIADMIKNKKRMPHKTIAVTFDDGYKDNYDYAFPILKKYGLAATVFIITQEVGRPEGDRLSWDEIKSMRDSGLVTVGSHCIGPEPLTKITSEETVKREIFGSKKVLEKELGRPVNAFSYPEGRFNLRIRQLVIDAGYKAAVATKPGKGFPNDDIFALKRLRIWRPCDNIFVFWFEASGFYNFFRENKRR